MKKAVNESPVTTFEDYMHQQLITQFGVSTYEELPKGVRVMMEGKGALSESEQHQLKQAAGHPEVEDHWDTGVTPIEDFYFFGWTLADRVRV